MGCDIHLYTETKRTKNGEEYWWCADYFTLNPYYHDEAFEDEKEYECNELWGGRNYDVFTALAGVRNTGVEMIDKPRGLPDDVSEVIKKFAEEYAQDGHSHSWLTAEELLKYDKRNPGIITYLVKAVKKRMREVFNFSEFFDGSRKDFYKKYGEQFRIVFWFDN